MVHKFLQTSKDTSGFILTRVLIVVAIMGVFSIVGFLTLTLLFASQSQQEKDDKTKIQEVVLVRQEMTLRYNETDGFPQAKIEGVCETMGATLQYRIGETLSGIEWDNNDYFYCTNNHRVISGKAVAKEYVIGAKNINADHSILKSDVDGDARGTITAPYASASSDGACGANDNTDTVFCLRGVMD